MPLFQPPERDPQHDFFTYCISLLFASSLSLAWPAAQAQVPAPSQWGLGLGVGLDRKPYRDFDNDVQALPLLLFENRYVSFFGAALDLGYDNVSAFIALFRRTFGTTPERYFAPGLAVI